MFLQTTTITEPVFDAGANLFASLNRWSRSKEFLRGPGAALFLASPAGIWLVAHHPLSRECG